MKQFLFAQGSTNLVSKTFEAPAQLALFNATATEHIFTDGIVTSVNDLQKLNHKDPSKVIHFDYSL